VRRPLAILVCAVALATLAASLASLALFVVATGLALLTAAAGAVVTLAAGRVTVARFISAREVQEDASILLHFSISRMTRLPVRLEIEDHSGGWILIGDGKTSIDLRVGRRGAHWLAPSRVRVCDALGIFERRLLAGRLEPLLILPAPQQSASLRAGRLAIGVDLEPQGLRPYASGTPLSRIHWPSLARGAGLQVRHLAPWHEGLPLVVVDTAGAPSSEAVDWAARTAAGYILTLARSGGCRVRLPGDAGETSVVGLDGEWRAMQRRLSMLGDGTPGTTATPAEHQLHVRAAMAPAGLMPAPPLPPGVLPRLT
jgi:uncharacterized protein (DUF58 family)